jgi:hypothetical protein
MNPNIELSDERKQTIQKLLEELCEALTETGCRATAGRKLAEVKAECLAWSRALRWQNITVPKVGGFIGERVRRGGGFQKGGAGEHPR